MELRIDDYLLNYKKESYVDEVTVKGTFIDCSYGTNPYEFSEKINVGKVFSDIKINQYPHYPYIGLKKDLIAHWEAIASLSLDMVRMGSGSMDIITTLNSFLINQGDRVLGYAPQFTDYVVSVRSHGGIYDYVPLHHEAGFKLHVNQLLEKINSDYKSVYIDNPNNPTGQVIPVQDIEKIIKKCDRLGISVIVDEAYGEFMDKENSAISLVNQYRNLFVVRSFSKGFGLAGLRVGYVVMNNYLGAIYTKVNMPFKITDFASNLCRVALKDDDFICLSREKIRKAKDQIMKAVRKLEIAETNMEVPIFLLRHPKARVDMKKLLMDHGVLTQSGRDFTNLDQSSVRIRIPVELDQFIEVLHSIENSIGGE